MAYGEHTKVPAERTVVEIVAMVRKKGGAQIAQLEDPDRQVIAFTMDGRQVRFTVHFDSELRRRQRMRALMLVIKAKLESVESKVETFEEAFLANVVMSDGKTIYEQIRAPIALEYKSGKSQPLLPPPAARGEG